jgi:hypothetical protein
LKRGQAEVRLEGARLGWAMLWPLSRTESLRTRDGPELHLHWPPLRKFNPELGYRDVRHGDVGGLHDKFKLMSQSVGLRENMILFMACTVRLEWYRGPLCIL